MGTNTARRMPISRTVSPRSSRALARSITRQATGADGRDVTRKTLTGSFLRDLALRQHLGVESLALRLGPSQYVLLFPLIGLGRFLVHPDTFPKADHSGLPKDMHC